MTFRRGNNIPALRLSGPQSTNLFNGVEKTNVEEYCVSEGWVRLSVGNARDRKGQPMTIKLKGKVEPFLKPVAP